MHTILTGHKNSLSLSQANGVISGQLAIEP